MPRTFLNTVRGYKDQTYWENQAGIDCENVMKTRSGLRIKTVPSARRSSSKTNTRTISNQQPTSTQDTRSPKWYKISPNNMSCLSFVTRYNMLVSGSQLSLADFPDKIEGCATLERELMHRERDREIDNIAEGFRAQLVEFTESTKEENLRGDVFSNFEKQQSDYRAQFRVINEKRMKLGNNVKGQPKDAFQAKTKNSPDKTSSAQKGTVSKESASDPTRTRFSDLIQVSGTIAPSSSTTEKPILSKTKVLLTVTPNSSTARSYPSCSFPQNNLVQAHLPSGQPLMYNSIPVMIINRITSSQDKLPPPASPLKLKSNPGDNLTRSGGSPRNCDFSPRRSLSCDTEKGSNMTDTDDDGDSSDTCSQGSQDSNISDFDLSIFQMESHSFAQDANGNQTHKCKLCDRVFTVFHAFKTHVNSHVRVKNRCALCGKIFSRSWLLKGHMRTHTGEKPFECPHPNCQKRFADKSNLRSHQLIHTITDKSYICPKCNRAFAQKRYLHKHRLEVCKF